MFTNITWTGGEINLVNSKYATTRFAFSWSWWSAYGWQVNVGRFLAATCFATARTCAWISDGNVFTETAKVKQQLVGGNETYRSARLLQCRYEKE